MTHGALLADASHLILFRPPVCDFQHVFVALLNIHCLTISCTGLFWNIQLCFFAENHKNSLAEKLFPQFFFVESVPILGTTTFRTKEISYKRLRIKLELK